MDINYISNNIKKTISIADPSEATISLNGIQITITDGHLKIETLDRTYHMSPKSNKIISVKQDNDEHIAVGITLEDGWYLGCRLPLTSQIIDLKKAIMESKNIPIEQQTILSNNRPVQDNTPLRECDTNLTMTQCM